MPHGYLGSDTSGRRFCSEKSWKILVCSKAVSIPSRRWFVDKFRKFMDRGEIGYDRLSQSVSILVRSRSSHSLFPLSDYVSPVPYPPGYTKRVHTIKQGGWGSRSWGLLATLRGIRTVHCVLFLQARRVYNFVMDGRLCNRRWIKKGLRVQYAKYPYTPAPAPWGVASCTDHDVSQEGINYR